MPYTEESDTDYMFNEFAKCPHCDFEDQDSFEKPESGETSCSSCGGRFHIEREVEVTYSTEPIS